MTTTRHPIPMMCISCESRPAMPSGLCEACALEEEEHYTEIEENSEIIQEFEQYKKFNTVLDETTAPEDEELPF